MKIKAVFGSKCGELLAYYAPELYALKMLQTSFGWGDVMLLEALPKSGTIVNGQLYQLQTLVPHIREVDGSVWAGIPVQCLTRDSLLPTPTATGSEHRTRYSQGGRPLLYMIQKGLLPTPTCNEAKNSPHTPSQWKRLASLNVEATKLTGITKEEAITGKAFQLNPRFVEEMMGFPIGWTELEP